MRPLSRHAGRLGSRIMLAVLTGTLAVALCVTALQAYLLWQQARHEAGQRFFQIEQSYLPSLVEGLWVIDNGRIDVLLDGIAQLPDVRAVELVDDAGHRFRRGESSESGRLAQRLFQLEKLDEGEHFALGTLEVELHDEALRRSLWAKLQVSALTTGTALLASGLLIGWLLRRWVTRPLKEVVAQAELLELEQLAERPLQVSPDIHTIGELQQLVDSLERMRLRLAEALERRDASERELQAYRHHLEQLVGERTAELQRQNAELDAYAHTVAHDLKHPLTALQGAAQLLDRMQAQLDTERRALLLDSLQRNALLMGQIIDALLLLARARGDQPVPSASLDLRSIALRARERLADLARQESAEVQLADAPWPHALGHAPWVEEALINYLSNAIRYGGTPPRIRIGANSDPSGMTRVWVRDRGEGVSADRIGGLFDRFIQPDLRRADSHGLGLSIVKRIIERQGGEVGYLRRQDESEFWFSLPAKPAG